MKARLNMKEFQAELKQIEESSIKTTMDWMKKHFDGAARSKNAIAVEGILNADGGCRISETLAKAFSVVLGEPVNIFDFDPGVVVVLTANPNEHNYPLECPVLVLSCCKGGYRGLMKDGAMGNHLPCNKAAVRPATEDEIRKFFSDFGNTCSRYNDKERGIVIINLKKENSSDGNPEKDFLGEIVEIMTMKR